MNIKSLIIYSLSIFLGFSSIAAPTVLNIKTNTNKTDVIHSNEADQSQASATTSFITLWEVSNPDTIIILLAQNETYDFNFEWLEIATGDIAISGTHSSADGDFMTPFDGAGEYELHINGLFPVMANYPKEKLLDVLQWGNIVWKTTQNMFEDWPGSGFTATDAPDLSIVTNAREMFNNATNFNSNLNNWNVSNISSMMQMFNNCIVFNGDISSWDVSSVANMELMFGSASSFNQDISQWSTPNLQNMKRMFINASSFNQDIGGWDVSSVVDMTATFNGADSFNSDISGWDVSSVKNMRAMFANTDIFDQDISGWDVSAVTSMFSMFDNTTAFDQDIGEWDVSSVTNMDDIFENAASFNHSLGGWIFNPNVQLDGDSFEFGPAMDCNSWSSTIIGWAINNPSTNDLAVGGSNTLLYDATASIFRDELIASGWSVGGTLSTGDCIMEKYWLGTQDSDWENADNWGPVGVPIAEDIIVIPQTLNNPILDVSTEAIESLEILNGATLTIKPNGNLNLED